MKKTALITSPGVAEKFAGYPPSVRKKMKYLRSLVIETAEETNEIRKLEETLKWGEPAYIAPHGSTFRIDWKEKTPGQYAMYFQCTSRLVNTFKAVFGNKFQYESTRAIIFTLEQEIPVAELKLCIIAALHYHKVKHLATLGI